MKIWVLFAITMIAYESPSNVLPVSPDQQWSFSYPNYETLKDNGFVFQTELECTLAKTRLLQRLAPSNDAFQELIDQGRLSHRASCVEFDIP